jgi:GR25 family glycosyltransferase involved in LPS biosynthesis
MTAEPPYHGLYINLDRSTERRVAMDKQLDRLGLSSIYARFPALDGATLVSPRSAIKPGENGCFQSHYRALLSARSRGKCVHMVEDDVLLSESVRPVIEQAIAQNVFDQFDVVFTDIFVPPHLGIVKFLKAAFDELPSARPLKLNDLKVVDLADQNFACTTSLVVGAKSIDRVLALYQQEIALGPRAPLDLFLRTAANARQLRAACLFPFVTSFNLDEVAGSTLHARSEKTVESSVVVLAALRYSFFVDRDIVAARRYLDAATAAARTKRDEHRALIGDVLDFIVSSEFKEF